MKIVVNNDLFIVTMDLLRFAQITILERMMRQTRNTPAVVDRLELDHMDLEVVVVVGVD